jgi:hypothetical protein
MPIINYLLPDHSRRFLRLALLWAGLAFMGYIGNARAQDQTLNIQFRPTYQGKALLLQHPYVIDGDTISVTQLRFLVGNFRLWDQQSGQQVAAGKVDQSYRLVDAEDPPSFTIPLAGLKQGIYDLGFSIGVDSITSKQGVKSGALDPTKGMFWAWNTGYIFVKVEGTSSASTARKHLFGYHLGGAEGPHKSLQSILLKGEQSQLNPASHVQTMQVDLALDQWLHPALIKQSPTIMEVGPKGAAIARQFAHSISVQTP